VRVVAGVARGRRLVAPDGTDTRPTSDRVRESVFNALASRGAVTGATVLDLFAGSGALGIEALSRGATRCTFVERARPALRALRDNLRSTGLEERAQVVAADAATFLRTCNDRYDLALLDPPYAYDEWTELLDTLPAQLAVIESDRAIPLVDGWVEMRTARYGGTVVLFARRAASN
jgi:16S rRNA (guanine966-N2)-methyltransferase